MTAALDQALPGIGHRYELRSIDGGRVVVVVHHSGRRDLYAFAPGGDEPQAVVTLSDAQARTLGAILGGAYFKPAVVEEIEAVIGGLLIDWITLEPAARGVGSTIGDLEIRQRTGITVAAILRDHTPLIAPDPTEQLQAGDQLAHAAGPGRALPHPRHPRHRGRAGPAARALRRALRPRPCRARTAAHGPLPAHRRLATRPREPAGQPP